jgi:hypothetical protein
MELLTWDIYEVSSEKESLNGVMLRGRIRKFCLEKEINVLTENTEDADNRVRFSVLSDESIDEVENYLQNIVPDVSISCVMKSVKNPVLSKMKVNQEERYTL